MSPGKSESLLIDWLRRQGGEPSKAVTTGIGDDMAVLRWPDQPVLITTDVTLEGVHFESPSAGGVTYRQAGYKAMSRSLSDCAAMASSPVAAVVAVALSNNMSMETAKELYQEIRQAAKPYDCPVVGGDTTSWDGKLAVTVSMLSRTEGEPVLRSTAKVGDAILVTGDLGGSRQGKHIEFEPRVKEALQLRKMVDLHAMIDISDGLGIDLNHICEASGVDAIVDEVSVPLSTAARKRDDPLGAALSDGEDFELLFCISPSDADRLLEAWKQRSRLRLNCIGQIIDPASNLVSEIEGKGRLYLRKSNGSIKPLPPTGWQHFRD